MFESFRPPDTADRLRGAAIPPFAAFLALQLYFTLYPLFGRVPPWLFWVMDALVLAGAVTGAALIARVVFRERIRGRAILWLVLAILATLVCVFYVLRLTFPWL